EAEIEEIKINIEVTVPQETCIVSVTEEGYIKRTSLRSYGASNKEDLMIKSTDRLVRLIELDTKDNILLFTNFGKYVCIPVDELVNAFVTDGEQDVFIATHLGYGLWFSEQDVSVVGQRALGVIGIQLKDNDYVVNGVAIDESEQPNLIVATQRGAAKRMKLSE